MTQETALGAAFKSAIQTISRKKQTEMISQYVYEKYPVFAHFRPLAIGIDQDLIAALPQHDPVLVLRVLSNHCRRPRYVRALSKGGKRFDLNYRAKGAITDEEQALAQSQVQASQPAAPEQTAAEHIAPDAPLAAQESTNAPSALSPTA